MKSLVYNGKKLWNPILLLVLVISSFIPANVFAHNLTQVNPSADVQFCNWAQFVKDISIPDGTVLKAGQKFTKIWRVKNIGSCTWTPKYSIAFDSGTQMTDKKNYPLNTTVKPGETIDITLNMTAPTKKGSYQGFWMLRDEREERFGIGNYAKGALWVAIKVGKSGSESFFYDLASNYCQAEWRSGLGTFTCPGSRDSKTGSVLLVNNVTLENRSRADKVLVTIPNYARNGWVKGTFPTLKIQNGYHFISEIGCLDGSRRCDVTFRLAYRTVDNSRMVTIATWKETFDGKTTPVNVDLSYLAGKRIQLILRVEVNNRQPDRAYAFWLRPRIAQ